MTRQDLGVRLFLVAAVASFLLSIALWLTDNQDEGLFVGLWVPSILAAGGFWMAAAKTREPPALDEQRARFRSVGSLSHCATAI